MEKEGNNNPFRGLGKGLFSDQYFLLNFIVGTYLGPDVYTDNPRCSALRRLAKRSPPYTSNNLGTSFLSTSQLESLYYYLLRNAHHSLVLKPDMFYMYLKGSLHLPSLGSQEDHRQFTGFFPLKLHDHKRYSDSYEIVKGIALIDDPVTSYMKKEELERFRFLSGIDDLKIDSKKCLSYRHGDQNGGDETEASCITKSERQTAGTICNRNERSSEMFGVKYRRRRLRCHPIPIQPFSFNPSMSEQQNEESTSKRTFKLDGSAAMPIITLPKLEDCISDESIVLTGTARRGMAGPQVGLVDIGISKAAYFFQVALPGVRRDFCEFSCEIESDGKVHIQGSLSGGRTIRKRSRAFKMKFQQMCPPGPFTLSFSLPGPVDPRLFSPNFRTDGIFEAVIIKTQRKFSPQVHDGH
ncbi:hypothetical protein JCGZ_08039 [Jatropha curcas]|uniref:SHSP domain-containing protein n=1 Tax=Jatropha curcas TaxID=180498 RepID=A0A067KP53_JATCU|nr:increased DNA methylation 3 [Jatropha curcas]XP_012073584.1 increased DNA methylation 3 [Jatropha curcas]XP_020535372.1 increased DNA methylation 3 [Jatropha curcas]XP_020535373.1 increased DNA methylation 3 [Jatropha curcas]XP_020535374.1 increased DNA methylation 3 [Jatropha curcas]KDP36748.1 hypothetical protein JCGZ_08039 [Jatropha curcas]